jgi:SAM-dependent methyltransferase
MAGLRVNVGCGATPTEGWQNFDNSLTVRIGAKPVARGLLPASPFVAAVKSGKVRYANALSLPLADGSAEAIYSSHMVEHLDRDEARAFLAECRRVLKPGGFVRLAVPDLRKIVEDYLASEDADEMMVRTHLGRMRPRGLRGRARALVVGERNHMWMYDGPSLVRLVASAGFDDATTMAPGSTNIPAPGALDLEERADESVYVEALRPHDTHDHSAGRPARRPS